MTISVVLVDGHDLIRMGLRLEFLGTESLEVVGEARSVRAAKRVLTATPFDVVVTDLLLPDGSGLEVTSFARGLSPKAGVVMLTVADRDRDMFAALEAGVSAYVLKTAPSSEVVAAVRHAAVAPHAFAAADLVGAMQRRMTGLEVRLGDRELQILHLLEQGLSVTVIATRLGLAISTTKTYVARLYDKLGAHNKAQALMSGVHLGFIADYEPAR